MKYENKIVMAFTDPDESLDNPYSTFTDNYVEDNVTIMYVFDTPKEFLQTFNRIINGEEGPYGMWYWVLDHGKQICSGACDPDDIDIYEKYWNLNKENDEMKDNKRVKQISLDVVVGSETDGEDLAVQVKEELERRGYTIYGSGFQADLTEEYNIIDKNDDVDTECLIALLKDKVTKEYDVYTEELRHKTIDEVIENSYKTTMLKEFKTCFENYTQLHLENYQIKLLIRTSNILERLYEHWKTYDSDEFEIYKEFVFEFWNWEALEKENQN